jgi:carbon-monoxide dehydrogenase large subunit
VHTLANLGSYLSLLAVLIPTYLHGTLLAGQYACPAIFCDVKAVYTNTTPVDAARGAGRPEATYQIERMLDIAAHDLGIDPAELRRRNFIAKDRFPYQTPVALVYDSGNYEPALDRALEIVDYQALRAEQELARRNRRYIGIGISSYIEACGGAPSAVVGMLGAQCGLWESGTVRLHPTGKVTVLTGSHSHGQGHETTLSQIVADELGVAMDDVEIVHGDTGRIPFGMGTYGSRSLAVGGAAIHASIEKLKDKGRRIAAHLLEASVDDIEFAAGKFSVKGSPDRFKSLGDVVLAAYLAHNLPAGMEPGFEFTTFYDPSNFTFPFGTHIAVVEVDPATGAVKILKYVAVDDVGNVINPMIVAGQVHGGIAHGIGQAMTEQIVYDDNGQLLTASLLEYGLPRADQLPSFDLDSTTTPSPVNALGVKGVGEAGTIASTPAIANAVIDALSAFGIRHLDMPFTPARVWQAIQSVQGGGR